MHWLRSGSNTRSDKNNGSGSNTGADKQNGANKGRIKTMNDSIYYNVDAIHTSIAENKKIKFQYFQWNVKKEVELRHDGKYYQPFLSIQSNSFS